MLDRAKNVWTLLGLLTTFTVGFLALVIVVKPFRDTEDHTGWTVGDKSQAVAQAMLLVEFAMAALCVSFGGDLPALAEGIVILVCLGAIVFPIVYMMMLGKGSDMLGCLWPEAVADGTGGGDVDFANPMHDVDAGAPIDVLEPVAAKKGGKKKGGQK
jgi:hypothetical protein